MLLSPAFSAQAAGGIALGVQVHHQHPLAHICQNGREVHRRGGFAHAALLVGNRNRFDHAQPPFPSCLRTL